MQTATARYVGAVSLAFLCALLLSANGAEARKYTISGPTRALTYAVPQGLVLPLFNPPGAHGTADQMGSNPATLTLPAGAFNQPGGVPVTIPIPTPPQYVQFATAVYVAGAPTAPAKFSAGGGPGAFSFTPGTRPGKIVYSTVGPQFGGTMTTILGGAATTSAITVAAPTVQIRHVPLNLNVINGQSYGATSAGVGPPANITTGGVINGNGTIYPKGTTISVVPGFTRMSTGFPFTTGMIVITVPQNPPTTPDSAFTGTGSDTRSALGEGNITMVAGALGTTSLTGAFATLETISIHLTRTEIGVPALSHVGMAALVMVLAGAVFVTRRRI